MKSWLRNLFRRPSASAARREHLARPCVEALENRLVPSTLLALDFAGCTRDQLIRAMTVLEHPSGWDDQLAQGTLVGEANGIRDLAQLNNLWGGYSRYRFLDICKDGTIDQADEDYLATEIMNAVQNKFADFDVQVVREDNLDNAVTRVQQSPGHGTIIVVTGWDLSVVGIGGQSVQDDGNTHNDIGQAGGTVGVAETVANLSLTGEAAHQAFVGWMANFIAHEAGHTFGLHHVPSGLMHWSLGYQPAYFSQTDQITDDTHVTQNDYQVLFNNLGANPDGGLVASLPVVPQPASVRSLTIGGATFDFGIAASPWAGEVCYRDGVSQGWQGFPGTALTSVTPVNVGNFIKLFGMDSSGQLWVKSFHAAGSELVGDSAWLLLNFPAPVASYRVAVNGDGRLLVFAVTTDGRLLTSLQATTTSPGFLPYGGFSGTGFIEVETIQRPDGRLAVFTLQNSGVLQCALQTSPGVNSFYWAGAFGNPAPGVTVQSFVLDKDPDGRIELFAVGSNNRLYQAVEQAANANYFPQWIDLNHGAVSVAVGKNADGRLQVFVADTDGIVSFMTQTSPGSWQGSTWRSFNSTGGQAAVKVEVRNANGVLVVWAYTSAPGYSPGLWETREASPNQSESGWASWTLLDGGVPI
jgi:hypothetical protein